MGIPRRILGSRVTKWTLTAACILIALVWTLSYRLCPWFTITNGRANAVCVVDSGSMYADYNTVSSNKPPRWRVEGGSTSVMPLTWSWLPRSSSGSLKQPGARVYLVILPLHIPLLLFAVPTGYLWLRGSRLPRGHCAKCGYSLSGLTDSTCPECGTRAGVSA